MRQALGLRAPDHVRPARLGLAAAAVILLGLAAAQPALTGSSKVRARRDVAALFVVDTSRSMAASTSPRTPTRLDRAVATAERLRAAIGPVPSGIATLTDRVLPDLLPVPDTAGFDAVASGAVAIESPPPLSTAVRATNFAALAGIASGDYFAPAVHRRIVVLLTDGESVPFDQSAVARALSPRAGYRFLSIRFWRASESVYDANGAAEAGYRPDPLGRVLLDQLAGAMGGRAFEETRTAAAAGYLRALAGNGPSAVTRNLDRTRRPLGPYVAAFALLLLLASLASSSHAPRLQSISW